MKHLTKQDIIYVCRSMMGVDWLPSFIEIPSYLMNSKEWSQRSLSNQEEVLKILSTCQSKLEIMYLLGIGYYLHENGIQGGTSDDYPSFWADDHEGQKGIHISEPFCGGKYGNGLSSLLVIPQYLSLEKPIHHDFGLFSGESNGGSPWHFFRAVEIEGYGVHKQRRKEDESRYAGLSYQVLSLYEETSNPHEWYEILDPDICTGMPGEYCDECRYGNDRDDDHPF